MSSLKFRVLAFAAILWLSLLPLAFAEIGYKVRTLPEWQLRLGDPAPETRREAAVALGFFGVQAVPPLIHALGDSDNLVAHRAMTSLIKIGPESVPELARALRDSNENVAERSANALAKIGPASVPVLVDVLRDSNPDVQKRMYTIAFYMTHEGKVATVPALVDLFRDPDNEVRERTMRVLSHMVQEAESSFPEIVKSLDRDPKLQGVVINITQKLGPKAVPLLVQWLNDPNPEIRRNAVRVLASIDRRGAEDVTTELRRLCLNDPDQTVRNEAHATLKRIVGFNRKTGCEVPR